RGTSWRSRERRRDRRRICSRQEPPLRRDYRWVCSLSNHRPYRTAEGAAALPSGRQFNRPRDIPLGCAKLVINARAIVYCLVSETGMTTERQDEGLPEWWSAQRKTQVVRRVRGEALDEVAREIQVPVQRGGGVAARVPRERPAGAQTAGARSRGAGAAPAA